MQVSDISNFLGITNFRQDEPVTPAEQNFNLETAGEKKVLHSWKTINRQPKSMNTKLTKNLVIILAVIALVLVAMQEFLLIALIASMIFLYYILSSTPPEDVTHTITTHGVSFAGQFYYWNELKYYFFTKQGDADVLCADTVSSLPGRLYFIHDASDSSKIDGYFGTYLPKLEEVPTDFIDNAYGFVTDKFNFGD